MTTQNLKIQIMGVIHQKEYLEAVLRKLNQLLEKKEINPNKGIGIEITPEHLKLFEQWYPNPVSLGPPQEAQLQEYVKQIIQRMRYTNPKLKDMALRQEEGIREVLTRGLTFWYDVFRFAKRNNIRVTALDSEAAVIRAGLATAQMQESSNKTASWKGGTLQEIEEVGKFMKAGKYFNLVAIPMRENIFVRRIQQEKPDIVVVGVGHANAIKSKLKKQGFMADVVFKNTLKERNMRNAEKVDAERVRKTRKYYEQRKKQTRKWRRQKGILRRRFAQPR